MEKVKIYILLLLLVLLQSCSTEKENKEPLNARKLYLGADQLINENLDLIKNKRLGIILNRASVLSDGVLLIDSLRKINGIKISALFTPEHGFSINYPAGELIPDSSYSEIPVYSLYGKTRKPQPEMLKDIDILVFDLQDIGTRFYTYISTLFYVMQAAGENQIPLIVLDRLNPIGGFTVNGPVLNEKQKSFIGIAPIPVLHGMTIGELAEMFSGEGWIGKEIPSLKIIRMKNWRRSSCFKDYNLTWINTSPNIPDCETAILYPATGFIEGTNISEGRGTEKPFKQIGAPFINSEDVIKLLDSLRHPGLLIKPVTFVPADIPGKAENIKYSNVRCTGISFEITDTKSFKPVDFGIELLFTLHKLYPRKLRFDTGFFNKLMGDSKILEMLQDNKTPGEIIRYWQPGLIKFLLERKKYLLY
jgi:uncharacterized protein YbbC (DUF1343 family)